MSRTARTTTCPSSPGSPASRPTAGARKRATVSPFACPSWAGTTRRSPARPRRSPWGRLSATRDPDVDRLRSTLALILALAGAHARARRARRRAASTAVRPHRPGDRERHPRQRLDGRLARGRHRGALRDARSVARLLGGDRPGPMPGEWAAETLNAGEILMEVGRWDEAAACLDRVVAAGSITPRISGWAERLCVHLGAWRGTLDADGFHGLLGGPQPRWLAPPPGPAGRPAASVLDDRRVRLRRLLRPGARPRPVRARAGRDGARTAGVPAPPAGNRRPGGGGPGAPPGPRRLLPPARRSHRPAARRPPAGHRPGRRVRVPGPRRAAARCGRRTGRKPGARRWHAGDRPACRTGWPARCLGRDARPASG